MTPYALLIDPDTRHLQTYEHLLSAQGMPSHSARDGTSALVLLAKWGPPSLVVTELALHDQDGVAFVGKLKPKVDCPIIAITRFSSLGNAAQQRREALGLAAVLPIDLPLPVLDKALKTALAHQPVEGVTRDQSPLHLDPSRLAALAESGMVDDGPPDAALQKICADVATSLGVETALLSLVLADRQWFKGYSGLSGELLTHRGTPLDRSFCRHVVDAGAPLLVPDARANPAFAQNALVLSGQVRGYAGVPLQTSKGQVLGTLCVLDSRPITMTSEDITKLRMVARRLAGELELMGARKTRPPTPIALPRAVASGNAFEAVVAILDVGVRITDLSRQVLYVNEALGKLVGLPVARLHEQSPERWLAHLRSLFFDTTVAEEKLAVATEGPFAIRELLEIERPKPQTLIWTARPLLLSSGPVQVEFFELHEGFSATLSEVV